MFATLPATLVASDQIVYVHDHAWWPIFPLFWLVFWVVLVTFFLRRRRHWHGHHHGGGAQQVLAERYARGEIDDSEFQQRLAVLKGSSAKH